ncbi:MAG: M15 family metallopeptidase [Chthoniobacterales bacterium]
MNRRFFCPFAIAALVFATRLPAATPEPELVDIQTIDPTIAVELRYAGSHNIAQRPLYPAGMPALVRPTVAARLVEAQSYLQMRGFRLKIWDAYRPKAAHDQLWELYRNHDYVADPSDGRGSLHSWGVAIDATLVYENGKEVTMPTDFDAFTPAAMLRYLGNDPYIRDNLHTLQRAMGHAGFFGMRTEWWHFVAKDWQKYRAVTDVTISAR